MNKKNIVKSVTKKIKLSTEDNCIIEEIERAKQEWESAAALFELVKEPDMVDYAIYLQHAACVKYMHLLKLAKDKKISVGYYSGIKELNVK